MFCAVIVHAIQTIYKRSCLFQSLSVFYFNLLYKAGAEFVFNNSINLVIFLRNVPLTLIHLFIICFVNKHHNSRYHLKNSPIIKHQSNLILYIGHIVKSPKLWFYLKKKLIRDLDAYENIPLDPCNFFILIWKWNILVEIE